MSQNGYTVYYDDDDLVDFQGKGFEKHTEWLNKFKEATSIAIVDENSSRWQYWVKFKMMNKIIKNNIYIIQKNSGKIDCDMCGITMNNEENDVTLSNQRKILSILNKNLIEDINIQ